MADLWYDPDPRLLGRVLSLMLSPLELAYRMGLEAARRPEPQRVARPVISIGNLVVGGSGKTPLCLALGELLLSQGLRPGLVSRGYRRRGRGLLVFSPGAPPPASADVGDEPAILARRLPGAVLAIDRDRVRAAEAAIEAGAEVLLCDDAFQHRHLARDLDVLAVHAGFGFGNRRLLPRGPLREPESALLRADLVVFTHAEPGVAPADLARRHGLPEGLSCAACSFEPAGFVAGTDLEPYRGPNPRRVAAACGIAHPDRFFALLERLGLEVVARLSVRDHRPLGSLASFGRKAARRGAEAIVVTEKDLVKPVAQPASLPLLGLRLEPRFESESLRVVQCALARTLSAGWSPRARITSEPGSNGQAY